MARIRTIKPEFWRSPDTAAASPVARLLFIAMWNWADDAGRGEADLKALEGFAFPNDDVQELSGGTSENFRHVLAEVVDCFGLTLYMVDGRPYYEIPSWKRHQRNERTAKGKHPHPDEGVTCTVDEIGGKRRNFRRSPAELPQTSGPGTGEQGNRGTGEQRGSPSPVTLTKGHDEREPSERPTGRAVPADGWRLIRDHIPDSHPQAVRQDLAIRAGALLHAGTPEPDVRDALALWLDKPHAGPDLLPNLVSEVVRNRDRPTRGTLPAGHDPADWLDPPSPAYIDATATLEIES